VIVVALVSYSETSPKRLHQAPCGACAEAHKGGFRVARFSSIQVFRFGIFVAGPGLA